MITIQSYMDKLEYLKEYIALKIEGNLPRKANSLSWVFGIFPQLSFEEFVDYKVLLEYEAWLPFWERTSLWLYF